MRRGPVHILESEQQRVGYSVNIARKLWIVCTMSEFEPLETQIVEQLIKVLDSGMEERQHDEKLFKLLAHYKSRLTYLNGYGRLRWPPHKENK